MTFHYCNNLNVVPSLEGVFASTFLQKNYVTECVAPFAKTVHAALATCEYTGTFTFLLLFNTTAATTEYLSMHIFLRRTHVRREKKFVFFLAWLSYHLDPSITLENFLGHKQEQCDSY